MNTFIVPEITEDVNSSEATKTFESTESIKSTEEALFTYSVDKSSSNWVVTFNQYSKVRHHTSRLYYPYSEYNCRQGDQSIVSPNQWLEGLVNGRWSLLSDADNR